MRLLLLFLLVLAGSSAFAQTPADSARATPPIRPDKPSFIPLPGLFYSPETRLGVALFVAPVFRLDPDTTTRKSPTRILAYYTQEKQWSIQLTHSLFTKGERYALVGDWRFYDYPIFYYGVGDRTREEDETLLQYRLITFSERILRRVGRQRFFAGPQYILTSLWDIQADSASKLRERPPKELRGGVVSGLGPVLLLDTRDRLTFPTGGSYAELSATFTGVGGDYAFTRYTADLRRYFGLDTRGRQVLAVQVYGQFHTGAVPFRELAPLGGIQLLRGYYEGRYRDRQLVAVQAEYRAPLWRRLGFVTFIGVGDVADKVSEFDRALVAGGAGLRFTFNRRERLNVRADYGVGLGGSGGFYFSIGEAF